MDVIARLREIQRVESGRGRRRGGRHGISQYKRKRGRRCNPMYHLR